MNTEDMARIANEQGYALYIYVYAQRKGITRSLGKFVDVSAMTEDDLRNYIKLMFAREQADLISPAFSATSGEGNNS